MQRALTEAWPAGTRALRTHLDWGGAEAPVSLAVFEAAARGMARPRRAAVRGADAARPVRRGDAGERIAQAVQRAGGVLGAFVYRNDGIVHKLGRVFDLAQAYGLALDFHVDEGLDADATGLRTIAQLMIARGLQGRVACGHACSLSVQDDAAANETLALCAQAGIHLSRCPPPTSTCRAPGTARRCSAASRAARSRGAWACAPSLATDNVQDAFYPYGGYDLVETFGLGVQMAHLAPAADWLDAITVSPARRWAWPGTAASRPAARPTWCCWPRATNTNCWTRADGGAPSSAPAAPWRATE